MIKDHHEGYISWEDYLNNQRILEKNRTNGLENITPTVAREGLALLQGLLICGRCGYRLTVRYTGNNGIHPTYQCNWQKRHGVNPKSCFSVLAAPLDQTVSKRILTVMNSSQIDIAIETFEELEQRGQALDNQWKMKIDRADYETQIAQRRYEEVDPSNRLVAATLEKRWNASLVALEEIYKKYAEYQEKNSLIQVKMQKEDVIALAKNFHVLWHAGSTNTKDRKRILRLLIKDITVEKLIHTRKSVLHIRWQGGATESIAVELPQKSHERWRHSPELITQVRELALTLTDQQIVEHFNKAGLKTNKGNSFTVESIQWIRFKHKIPSPRLQKEGEISIKQAAEKFNVSHHVIRYWVERGMINARPVGLKLWIFIEPKKELELKKVVESSTKIATARSKSQTQIVGGVL